MALFVSAEQVQSSLGTLMLAESGIPVGAGARIVLSQVGAAASPDSLHLAFCPGIVLDVEEQWEIKPRWRWREYPDRLLVRDPLAHRLWLLPQNEGLWTGFLQFSATVEVYPNAVIMTAVKSQFRLAVAGYNHVRFAGSFKECFGDLPMAAVAQSFASAS